MQTIATSAKDGVKQDATSIRMSGVEIGLGNEANYHLYVVYYDPSLGFIKLDPLCPLSSSVIQYYQERLPFFLEDLQIVPQHLCVI